MFLEIQIEVSTRKSILLLTIRFSSQNFNFRLGKQSRHQKCIFKSQHYNFFKNQSCKQKHVLSQKKLKVDICMKRYFLHQLSNFDSKIGFDIKNIFLNMRNQYHFLSLLVLFSQKKSFLRCRK